MAVKFRLHLYSISSFDIVVSNSDLRATLSIFSGILQCYNSAYSLYKQIPLAKNILKIRAEDVSNRGRIDLSIEVGEKIYILGFKVGKSNALEQIRQKRYYEKYMDRGKRIYLVGINFDEEQRNIAHFEWDEL